MSEVSTFPNLLARVRASDAGAAEELVRRYESAIRVAVRIRLTDPHLRRQFDSLDICQSVLASFFARAAVGQYDLDSPAQLVALLVRMAQNKLIAQTRFHRAERRDVRRLIGIEAGEGAAETAPGPHTIAASRDLLEAVRARLTPDELDVADRRAVGQEWAEIAKALGGTADQRRVQFKRAMDRVSAELDLASDE